MERFCLAALCRAPHVGSRIAASLVRTLGTACEAWRADEGALRAAGLSAERAAALHGFAVEKIEQEKGWAAVIVKGGGAR